MPTMTPYVKKITSELEYKKPKTNFWFLTLKFFNIYTNTAQLFSALLT